MTLLKVNGVVISDWGGTHNTMEAITNGLDMEFGSWTNGLSNGRSNAYDSYYLADPYLSLIKDGKVTTQELDDKVRRVLRLILRTEMNPKRPFGSLCSEEHYNAARKIGDEGIVLLQNNRKILPLNLTSTKRILVVGENAIKMMTVGGGSSSLKVQREVSPLEGIRNCVGNNCEIVYARGYVGDISGEYNGVVTGQNLSDDRSASELIAEAVNEAKKSDYVIFIGGLNKSKNQDCEDSDRAGLELPYQQDEVIEALADANKNLIVVNISGNAVAMPWVKKVPAIVQAWFIGSEAGNSIADVIFGKVNPSGKLPFTFPVALEHVAAHAIGEYPGIKRNDEDIWDEHYNEGILVGYRWHDTKKIPPLFAFGHGLSYTTFELGKVKADKEAITGEDKVTFTVPVTNTGKLEGAEVIQLYLSDPKCSVKRPVKELKGFSKVFLQPGETKNVSFEIGKDDLSYFDAGNHKWTVEPGEFKVHIGAASDDIRSSTTFKYN